MNAGICDSGRFRQISFQVAAAVLEQCSSTVPLHTKQTCGACRGEDDIIPLELEYGWIKKVVKPIKEARQSMVIKVIGLSMQEERTHPLL